MTLDGSEHGGFMDAGSDTGSANVIDLLQVHFNRTEATVMLAQLHRVQRVMQYMLNPDHDLLRFDQIEQMGAEEDAFTFSIKAVMRRLCQQKKLPVERCGGWPVAGAAG